MGATLPGHKIKFRGHPTTKLRWQEATKWYVIIWMWHVSGSADDSAIFKPGSQSFAQTRLVWWLSKVWRPTRQSFGHFSDDVTQVWWPNQQWVSEWAVFYVPANTV